MPGFNGTGPSGGGLMTGGARGWCNPVGARYAGYRPRGLSRPLSRGYRSFWGLGRPRRGAGRGLFGSGLRGRGIRGRIGRGRRMW